jgi:Zn-dependent peptidase ImmA (M78 family)/transcriptional regulator with XRE-family HTH domain
METKEIALKIKRLRELNGMTQAELAEKAGLSRMAYNSIEKGRSEPRASNLYRIAKALDKKIQELMEPMPEMAEVRFRCGKCRKRKEKDMRQEILLQVKLWLKNYCQLEDIVNEKKSFEFPLPVEIINDPVACAQEARKKFELDEKSPINDICGLVEDKGIKLYFFDMILDKLFGLSLIYEKKYPAIAVNMNKNINIERQIFTIAHELGHLLMHKESFDVDEIDEIDLQEDKADMFAGHFLMPDAGFEAKWEENKGLHWMDNVLDIKRYFKVSYKTVLKRIIDKKMASPDIYRFFNRLFKMRYRHDLKGHFEPFGQEKVDFIEARLNRLVREAIEKELISVSRAADILGISLEDMLEKGRSWNPPDGETTSLNQ